MVGSGAIVFAVMGYIIANQTPDRKIGSQVRLNPVLLATILGESQKDIQKAIEFLCAPDPKSTTKVEGGRRLKKIGEFDYQVVNGAKYRAIRDEEVRREQNREAQRTFRKKNNPLPGELEYIKAQKSGASQEELDRITDARATKAVIGKCKDCGCETRDEICQNYGCDTDIVRIAVPKPKKKP